MASVPGGSAQRRQRRMGPAPFASFEDLSDEVRPGTDNSPDGQTQRLPGISEDASTNANSGNSTLIPSAPRIDISRASSSSQPEDSRDSTPERELFQTPGQKLGLAFREEGALELRSSTEELDFQDPNDQPRRGSPATIVIASTITEGISVTHQRKDSQGSEYGGLLSISGRTSRLSSIGSQGSHVSGASRLSVTSGMSRSPSPHKMLLETSFCGSKSDVAQNSAGAVKSSTNKIVETELLERVLLSRKHDPTEAILAEGISIECRRKIQPADSLVQLSPVLQHAVQHVETPALSPPPLGNISVSVSNIVPVPKSSPTSNSKLVSIPDPTPIQGSTPSPVPPEKPARKSLPAKVSSDVIITVNKPSDEVEVIHNDTQRSSPSPGKIIAESGIEYTFIPLKGPLPQDLEVKKSLNRSVSPTRKISNTLPKASSNPSKTNTVPVRSNSSCEPQYIRIKLKPDHMYPEDPSEGHTKPVSLDLSNGTAASAIRKNSLQNNTSTPSPSISRKSSFASLFRGKDYGTSPESPTLSVRNTRSRSKSSDRDRMTDNANDKQSKHRSVFTLFKSKKTYSKSKQSLTTDTSPNRNTAASLHSLEFTFDRPPPESTKKYYEIPLDSDTIIIPLHSPGSEPPPLPLYACDAEPVEARTEARVPETTTEVVNRSHRQSSTSSENVVFTTNLGSDNEVFTTKLPKHKNERECDVEVEHSSTPVVLPETLSTQNGILIEEINKKLEEEKQPPEKIHLEQHQQHLEKNSEKKGTHKQVVNVNERPDGNHSSESDSETLPKAVSKRNAEDYEKSSEPERKGLMLQQDSFDDELPYVPTTLPLERSVAIPIVPIKQRASFEIRTCPIERPRSATPINPSCLEDFCEDPVIAAGTEKLRISLPREDSVSGPSSIASTHRVKSPRRLSDFSSRHQRPHHKQIPQTKEHESAPPLPPRGAPRDWINFEEIPERRKPPKRIQTIPSRGTLHAPPSSEESSVVYSYVNPEDCKCECHESSSRANPTTPTTPGGTAILEKREEDELPLLLSADRRSDSSPESQGAPTPPVKKSSRSSKSTNAFPHTASTSS